MILIQTFKKTVDEENRNLFLHKQHRSCQIKNYLTRSFVTHVWSLEHFLQGNLRSFFIQLLGLYLLNMGCLLTNPRLDVSLIFVENPRPSSHSLLSFTSMTSSLKQTLLLENETMWVFFSTVWVLLIWTRIISLLLLSTLPLSNITSLRYISNLHFLLSHERQLYSSENSWLTTPSRVQFTFDY